MAAQRVGPFPATIVCPEQTCKGEVDRHCGSPTCNSYFHFRHTVRCAYRQDGSLIWVRIVYHPEATNG